MRWPVRPLAGHRRRTLRTSATGLVLLVSLTVFLSACSNNGLALAREACGHVDASIRAYTKSLHETDPAKARQERLKATKELEAAWPIAAAATSADPQWNPLQTTLQEIGRNSESHLLTALRAQCAVAQEPNEQAPAIPPVPVPKTSGATTSPSGTSTPATGSTGGSTGSSSVPSAGATAPPGPSTLPGQ